MRLIKILMIDDEVLFCNLVKMNLELLGKFYVQIAHDGKEGVKVAKDFMPDVILLDIVMPRQDGFQTLEALKKDTRTISIPVIMLSALTDEKAAIRASSLFSEHYVTKPISAEKLVEKIEWVLDIDRA